MILLQHSGKYYPTRIMIWMTTRLSIGSVPSLLEAGEVSLEKPVFRVICEHAGRYGFF